MNQIYFKRATKLTNLQLESPKKRKTQITKIRNESEEITTDLSTNDSTELYS